MASQADVIQLRGQERTVTICSVRNGTVEEFSSITLKGVGIRVFVDGKSWGFSSTNRLDKESLKGTFTDAVKLARATSALKKARISLPPVKASTANVVVPVKKPLKDFSSEDVVRIASDAYKGTKATGPTIASAELTFVGLEDDKYFLGNEGIRVSEHATRVLLIAMVMARSEGTIAPASENLGHTGGLELFDKTPPETFGRTVAEKAMSLLKAKKPPSGRFRVVIHPTLCATLLHEAIGHPLEADIAMAGGGFDDQISRLVSSKLITIYDDGCVPGGLGYFPFDDEGVECKHTVLLENGVLKSFMHDRTSAALASATPTGNAHAWDYSAEPLIRQTNIGIEAGDFALEEMIEDVKEGLFLEGTFGGQADANGDFTFGFRSARWIHHGELGEELRGANVAGNAIEVFKTIDAVGKEATLRPGACGKGQWAIQGRVVPPLRCEIMVGGVSE
ncbi:MAG TPA: TldD/PmbA family protein [Candidatus Bathyarchaeia archaeon]|nr:TldD/PmbA family protein [Candidatus Bathyarchaeia archaeon]